MLERDVELYLWERPELLGVSRWLVRQMRFPSGGIDLLGVDSAGIWRVVEVKRARKDDSGLLQLYRYLDDAQDIQQLLYGEAAPGVGGILVTANLPMDMLLKDAEHLGVRVFYYQEGINEVNLKEWHSIAAHGLVDRDKRLHKCAETLGHILLHPAQLPQEAR